jgi:AcrR family transcriptional regulator
MNIHSLVTKTASHDDKREAILLAALALFSDRGFHGVAVPEIAEHAGVGAGTIYRHFESKEAIVNALYQRWKGSLSAALLDEFPYTKSPRAQIEHVVDRLFGFAKKHAQALKFLEAHHHAPYLDVHSKELEARLAEPVRAFFEQHGRVTRKAQPELLFGILWGGVMGVVRASWEGYLALDHVVIEQTKDAIWNALRRPES